MRAAISILALIALTLPAVPAAAETRPLPRPQPIVVVMAANGSTGAPDTTTPERSVRPVARLSLRYRREMEIIRQQAMAEGAFDDVRFVTERSFDAATRHNAALLHGSRHPDPDTDAAARAVVREMSGTATVGDLRDRIGHGGAGFRAVVRLVGAGVLAPLRHERLTSSTLLLKKDHVQ